MQTNEFIKQVHELGYEVGYNDSDVRDGDYGSDLLDFLGVAVNSAFLESGASQDEED